MVERALSLTWKFIRRPTKAAEASKSPDNFGPNVWLYAAFVVASMLFYWLKPFDFPDVNAAFPREDQGLWFWFKVMLWQPPLELAWILFLIGLSQWLREGTLAVKLATSVLWTALPFIFIVAYAQLHGIPKTAFAVGELVSFALFIPALMRFPAVERMPVVSFMLGLNVLGLIMIVPMIVAVGAGSSQLFDGSQIAAGLWMVGAGTLGLRTLTGMRLPRAFMAVLLSMFFQISFAFALHFLGLVPASVLKALLYA